MAAELTRKETAAALGVSLHELRARAKDPSCPLGEGVKRSGRLMWSLDAIEATKLWASARAERPKRQKVAAETARTTESVSAEAANGNCPRPADEPLNAQPAGQADAQATQEPQAAPSGADPVAADPIALWLDMCRNAAALFQQSTDPRRAFLLMNPFAPFAAFAPFAQSSLPFNLIVNGPMNSARAATGLGVWGAPLAPLGALTPTPRPTAELETPSPERAAAERGKLYARGATPPSALF